MRMKKITKNIFLSLALLACGVSPLATSLSFGVNRDIVANTNESQVVDSDDVLEDDPVSDDDTGNSGESEPITYTYKSYLDYFIDNMDCTGVYDTDGNLTNVTISAEKKAEILSYDFTGSGTASDPYKVNTTQGYWYMTKFASLTDKSVELNCDVILNDETFDDDGNPSGGDGVVYVWEEEQQASTKLFTRVNFSGNNKHIKGVYAPKEGNAYFIIPNASTFKDIIFDNIYIASETDFACLFFATNNLSNFENITVSNKVSLHGVQAFGLTYYVAQITNCNIYANIYLKLSGAGIAQWSRNINDCNFYGNIYFLDYETTDNIYWLLRVGGILSGGDALVEVTGCKNYGKFIVKGMFTGASRTLGGIVGYGRNLIVRDCINYSNLDNTELNRTFVGGVVGLTITLKPVIKNCTNYGNMVQAGGIVGEMGDGGVVDSCTNYGTIKGRSAIVGTHSRYDIYISNCRNYGDLYGKGTNSEGILVGICNSKGKMEIVNCYNDCNIYGTMSMYYSLIGYNLDSEITIKNCEINFNNEAVGTIKLISERMRDYQNIYLEDIRFNIKCSTEKIIYFVGSLEGILNMKNIVLNVDGSNGVYVLSSKNGGEFYGRNVYINTFNNVAASQDLFRSQNIEYVEGILYKSDAGDSYYYGTNFRDFYVSWKYGTIGLKKFDGVGSAQGSITTDWLNQNGWVKKG